MGLTAYDTHRIRKELSVSDSGNAEVSGALSLYLNFINLFTSLLQLFGNKE
jgi:FtsH-binding integral membrane protein